ncbi:TfoX/Sxy family protein [Allomuricauda sp. d1]|uniref:TfoX/Sxy family protein n=1 Tax=Allomuricauda sp. d1 TaxID=3136725 RepID=UPI0031D21B43
MGQKGAKITTASVLMAELILEKLSEMENITSKKMFGGHGIFHQGKMFGMVDSKGKAFLKSDGVTHSFFEDKGCQKHSKMPYYSIPKDVLNDAETLMEWARKSIEISKK